MELRQNLKGKFCSCCGRKNEEIWKNLMEARPILRPSTIGQEVREWKNHKVYKDNDYFYEYGYLKFCENCGEELQEEDINTTWESRGECHGTPCSEEVTTGYKCSKCGHNEVF